MKGGGPGLPPCIGTYMPLPLASIDRAHAEGDRPHVNRPFVVACNTQITWEVVQALVHTPPLTSPPTNSLTHQL
jgi:hypothetical protein